MEEGKQQAAAHLEKLREDARDEIKRRIEQRDKYSIQLTIALGAIVAIALSKGYNKILIVTPLISIYFTVLILYSYQIHRVQSQYLREKIEPALAIYTELLIGWNGRHTMQLRRSLGSEEYFL